MTVIHCKIKIIALLKNSGRVKLRPESGNKFLFDNLPGVAIDGGFHLAHSLGKTGENGAADEGVADVELGEVRHGG